MAMTMADFFDAVKTATTNSRASEEIMAALDTQGVTTDDLDAGDTLLATAKLKAGAQDKATLALRLHTPIYEAAEKLAHADYQDLVGACRAQLTPAQIKGLQIKDMPANPAKFVSTANNLLDAIPQDDAIKTALAKRKRDATRLAAIRATVKDFDDKAKQFKALKGALKQSTTDQNEAIKPLRAWFTQFSRFARLGLKSKKDLLGQILPEKAKSKPGKTKSASAPAKSATKPVA